MTEPTLVTEPAPPTKKPFNTVGLIAFIVGVIAFLFGVIPLLSFIAWLPALVAIGLAIGGLVIKNRSRVFAILGLILGILAIIIGIIVSLASVAGVANSVSDSIKDQEEAAAQPVPIVFEVTGEGVADITYSYTDENDKDAGATENAAQLPWSFEGQTPHGGGLDFNLYSLSVTTGTDSGEVSCKITVDGKVLSEKKSSGGVSILICSGSTADLDK